MGNISCPYQWYFLAVGKQATDEGVGPNREWACNVYSTSTVLFNAVHWRWEILSWKCGRWESLLVRYQQNSVEFYHKQLPGSYLELYSHLILPTRAIKNNYYGVELYKDYVSAFKFLLDYTDEITKDFKHSYLLFQWTMFVLWNMDRYVRWCGKKGVKVLISMSSIISENDIYDEPRTASWVERV